MSALLDWFRGVLGGPDAGANSAIRPGGFRAPPTEGPNDIPIQADIDEIFESDLMRYETRTLRKDELLAAVKSEQQCRDALESINTVLKKNKKDRVAIVDEEARCRRVLDKLKGTGDADKRQQVEKILNEELPQTLTMIDLNINKCKMKKRAIKSDLEQIAQERRKIVASYLKTFQTGENPASEDLPSELLFEQNDSSARKDRLDGEDEIWGDNDSDLEISDSDFEEEILQMAGDEDDYDDGAGVLAEDEGQKSTPLASRKV